MVARRQPPPIAVRDFAATCPEENLFSPLQAEQETRPCVGWRNIANLPTPFAIASRPSHFCRVVWSERGVAPDLARPDLLGRGPLAFEPIFDDGHHVFMLWQMMRGKHKMTLILRSQVFKQRDLGCLVGEDGIV